jgi:large subunit ribosomal protein L3
MKFILAKKLEMTQVIRPDGTVVPVTLVQAGPCVVTQVKTAEKDGVSAVQVGFSPVKSLNKPEAGHLKDLPQMSELRDFRVENPEMKRGDAIEASVFQPGDMVNVTGVSKGKGFQGVVKRHGFHGHPTSHGHKDQARMPGSIGAGGPQHVFKGRRMAGHMGHAQTTVQKLQVVEVRDGGILAIKGAVPGARHTVLEIVSAS